MGIVGLPNVGKSTLFNILCQMNVAAENYPFCTIEPNLSRVAVPDERFDWLVDLYKPKSVVPAFLQITDIAGLIRGASRGEGLGNAFLSHIQATDGIYQVVRVFEDEDVTHVEGAIDPIRDLEIINEELLAKDIETLTKHIASISKLAARDKVKKAELEICKKIDDWVRVQKRPARFGDWKAEEVEVLNELLLLTSKPTVYLVNMAEDDYFRKKNKWLAKIKQWVDEYSKEQPEVIIPFCGAYEAKLVALGPDASAALAKEKGVGSALPKIIKTGYHALNLIHFFTCGEDEVRAWTVRKYTKAPQAAGTIHTDMMNGFICAETMAFDDLKATGSETAVKAAGKHRQEGKNYTVEDGDIFFFKFNAGAGLAKGKK